MLMKPMSLLLLHEKHAKREKDASFMTWIIKDFERQD
jgi:hypothetical protein